MSIKLQLLLHLFLTEHICVSLLSATGKVAAECVSNLSVAQQVCGCARVEQCSKDVANAALKLPLQRCPPLGWVAFSTFGTSVGNTLWQLWQQLVHFIWGTVKYDRSLLRPLLSLSSFSISSRWQHSWGSPSVSCTDTDSWQDKLNATSAGKTQSSTCEEHTVNLCFNMIFYLDFLGPTNLSDSHTWHEPNGCNDHTPSSCCHSHHHHSTYHTVGRSSLREKMAIGTD